MSENKLSLKRTGGSVSAGVHLFKITDFEEGEGGAGAYWRYQLTCLDQGEDNMKQVMLFISLSAAARWKAEEFLDAVGAGNEGEIAGESFVGKQIRCEIVHDTYEGKMRAQVQSMLPAGTSASAEKQSGDGRPF